MIIRSKDFFVLSSLVLLAFAVRLPMVLKRPLVGAYQNEDAASHIMLTGRIIASRAFEDHHFLPIFTVGRESRNIDNLPSSGLLTAEGDFIYTSFPPLSFAIVAMIGEVSMDLLNPVGIRLVALMIGLVAAGGVYLVSREVARALGSLADREIGLLCAVLYLLAPECLHSFCVSLWAHQFYECLILYFVYACQKRSFGVALILLFCACLTEWSSYLAAGGAFLFYACQAWWFRNVQAVGLLALFAAVPVLALSAMLMWFGTKLPIPEYLGALTNRAGVRSFQLMEFFRLLVYALGSIGGLALIVLMGSKALITRRFDWRKTPAVVALPLVVIGLSLVENLMLAEHAKTYSFDRLKIVSFLCVCSAIFLSAGLSIFGRGRVFDVTVICSIGFLVYLAWRVPVRDWGKDEYKYSKALGAAVASDLEKCPGAVPVYDGNVRSDLVYYANANMVERYAEKALSAGVSPFDDFVLRGDARVRVLRYGFEKIGSEFYLDFPRLDSDTESRAPLLVPANRRFRWQWFSVAELMDKGVLDLSAPDRGIGMDKNQISGGTVGWIRDGFSVSKGGH